MQIKGSGISDSPASWLVFPAIHSAVIVSLHFIEEKAERREENFALSHCQGR